MKFKKKDLFGVLFIVSLTLSILAAIIFIIAYNSRPLQSSVVLTDVSRAVVILDAGHGGADGGAVSLNNVPEAQINLKITFKIRDFMGFLGIPAALTRDSEGSLDYDPGKTLRENKSADIKARLRMSQNMPLCDFLSIHLNKFGQSKYYGAQVFYGDKNADSQRLADTIQSALREYLDKDNERQAKPAPKTVFLMKNIEAPTVTVECGFLSNPEEEARLVSDEYQTMVAIAVTKGYTEYLRSS